MPDQIDIPIFFGTSRHAVDESRRVMVPVKWRPTDPNVEFAVVAWPLDEERYLLVMPPERWRQMLDKLKTNSLHDQDQANLERSIGSNYAPLTLDRVGRFCLPEHLAQLVSIEKEAEFVGRLHSFEIWSPARLKDAKTPENKKKAARTAKKINL